MGRSPRNRQGLAADLFEILLLTPWWVGPIVAFATFGLCRWAAPPFLASLSTGQGLSAGFFPTLAKLSHAYSPLAGGVVLLIWGTAELKKRRSRRLLEAQSGIESIRQLDWRNFESLLAEAFRRQAYVVDHTGSDAPDGGIDLRLHKDGELTLVQCKHWKARQVGVKIVRELLGVVTSERAVAGIVATSGEFTAEAIAFARHNPIRLIAGAELAQMIKIINGCEPAAKDETPGAVATRTPSQELLCPKCGAQMVQRVAKSGIHSGKAFWGCSGYPNCRGTRSL